MTRDRDTLLVGTRKGLLTFRRTATGWSMDSGDFVGIPVSYACDDARDGTRWVCLDHGHWGQKLHRSSDAGASWDELTPPSYPEGAETGDGQPAAVKYLWVLEPGRASEPGTLWIGTEPGGLFMSRDNGESFELVDGLWSHPTRKEQWFGGGRDTPGIHSVLLDPRDASRMLVGISCAGVFETLDGGATWSPRNSGLVAEFLPEPKAEVGHDPHVVVASPAEPDALWQQNHCGIFRSVDGARSWSLVSESATEGKQRLAHFGFAIAVDEEDPEIAWVVPAASDECRVAIDRALCVCRTQDGGATWEALREGLPQRGCFDIALRHALDVSGERLAFGTTTGNLFVSEDRGESWLCLGNFLPPIYSVRYAD